MELETSPNQDFVPCLETLPAEMWTRVIDCLEDPLEMYKCTLVCKRWKDLIYSNTNKTTLLFPLVIPFLEDYLSYNDMLSLRGVNSNGKLIANKYLENLILTPSFVPSFPPTFFDILFDQLNEFQFQPIRTRGPFFPYFSDVLKLLETYSGQNPFPNRTFTVAAFCDQGFQLTFSSLAPRFGHYVWHLVYFLDEHHPDSLTMFSQVFQLFPNLKSLSIVVNYSSQQATLEHGLDWLNQQRIILPDLRFLKIQFAQISLLTGDIPIWGKLIKPLLLAFGPQLESLEFNFQKFEGELYAKSTHNMPLANLKELKINEVSSALLQSICSSWGNCALRKVSFMHSTTNSVILFKYCQLILKTFSNTLEEAHFLIMPSAPMKGMRLDFAFLRDSFDETWSCPKIKTLGFHIELIGTEILRGFLCKCVNVENLQFCSLAMHTADYNEQDVNNYFNNTTDDVWDYAPESLRKISVIPIDADVNTAPCVIYSPFQ